MPMTMTEKILARASGKPQVQPGDNVWVKADVLMTHDVCGPGTIGIFKEQFGPEAKVFDRERVVIIPDHYIFTRDAHARRNVEILREFVREQGIKFYYDPDFLKGQDEPLLDPNNTTYKGVCHIALPEEGHTRPGEVLFGTDSHTCTAGAFGEFATGIGNTDAAFVMGTGRLWLKVPPTMRFVFEGDLPVYLMAKDLILAAIGEIGVDGATYRSMEFSGPAVHQLGRIAEDVARQRGGDVAWLNMEERMTLCNMVIEAGGKNGVIAADDVTDRYLKERMEKGGTRREYAPVINDDGASYFAEYRLDVSKMEPRVAKPHSPDNKASVTEVAGTKLDRAYLGSCTGGKITDYIAAAKVLNGRQVKVNTFIVPATTEIYNDLDFFQIDGQTLRQIFQEAGCTLGPPSCGACLGGPLDTLGRLNEPMACISSTNRNFPGRMGHKQAQVYLASPLTVAASAIEGRIADPRDYLM